MRFLLIGLCLIFSSCDLGIKDDSCADKAHMLIPCYRGDQLSSEEFAKCLEQRLQAYETCIQYRDVQEVNRED